MSNITDKTLFFFPYNICKVCVYACTVKVLGSFPLAIQKDLHGFALLFRLAWTEGQLKSSCVQAVLVEIDFIK